MNKLTTQETEMFSKATEIQEMWQPEVGDMVSILDDLYLIMSVNDITDGKQVHWLMNFDTGIASYVTRKDRKIIAHPYHRQSFDTLQYWIPTQEQMQNMVEPYEAKVYNIDVVNLCYPRVSGWVHDVFPTMRLLWLAFVMYRCFDKVWYANEWCVHQEDGSDNVVLPDGRIE